MADLRRSLLLPELLYCIFLLDCRTSRIGGSAGTVAAAGGGLGELAAAVPAAEGSCAADGAREADPDGVASAAVASGAAVSPAGGKVADAG